MKKVNESGSLVCCEVGCITPHFGLSSKTRAPWARRGRGMWFGVGTARDRPSTSRVARRWFCGLKRTRLSLPPANDRAAAVFFLTKKAAKEIHGSADLLTYMHMVSPSDCPLGSCAHVRFCFFSAACRVLRRRTRLRRFKNCHVACTSLFTTTPRSFGAVAQHRPASSRVRLDATTASGSRRQRRAVAAGSAAQSHAAVGRASGRCKPRHRE